MAKRFDQEAVRKIFVELVGNYMTASETRSEIASQIAEIVAGAPESLDTLKEIADWIENHAESAAEMNSEIKANTESINSLQTLISTLETQVSALETEVPTKTSELTNDSGFITESAIPTKVSAFENDSGYITEADVPTKLSELTDDVGYAKESEIPTKVSELENDSGYALAADVNADIQKVDSRIDGIISEGGEPNIIDTVQVNGKDLEVTNKTVNVIVPTKTSELTNDSGYATGSDIPTKTSDLTNDSGYITEADVPTKTSELENDSGYITDADVPSIEFGDDVMYVGSGDDKYWYLENEETFVYSDDSGLEYDEGSETITYPASDDFSYEDETISYTGGESKHLCDVIDKSTGDVYEIYDVIARENIENLEGSVETIAGEVTDLQEQTVSLKTEISDVKAEIAEVSDDVPTKTSELENDSGYITSADVPTKTSELENDSGFITSANVPTKLSELENDSDYATTAQVTAATKESVIEVTLSASGWSSAYPYTQTVSVSGVTSDSLFYVGILYPSDCDRDTQEEINEAAGYLFDIESGDGTVTFKATEKPEADIPLGLRGVF